VLSLAEGVLAAMRIAKLKLTAAAASALVAAAGGMTVATWAAAQNPPPAAPQAKPAAASAPAKPADELKYETDPNGAKPTKQQPGTGGAKRWAAAQNNLKQILLAMYNYQEANGHYPADVY